MFFVPDEIIEEIAENYNVYIRGLNYYRNDRVVDIKIDEKNMCVEARVLGSKNYITAVCFAPNGEIRKIACDCPAHYQFDGACKHVVALLKVCQQISRDKTGKYAGKDWLADNFINWFDYCLNSPVKKYVKLEPTLEIFSEMIDFRKQTVWALSLRMGEDKLYVVRNVKSILEAMENGKNIPFGKKFEYNPSVHTFRPEDQPVINFLDELYQIEKSVYDDSWQYNSWQRRQGMLFKGKQVILNRAAAKRLLSMLHDSEFNLKLFGEEYKKLKIIEQDMPLQFMLDMEQEDLVLRLKEYKLSPLEPTGKYFFFNGKVYRISEHQRKFLAPVINALNESPGGIRLSNKHKERFAAEVLPVIKQIGQVEISPAVKESMHEGQLKAEIYLDTQDSVVLAEVKFVYGEIIINPFAGRHQRNAGDKILVRDVKKEKIILDLLEEAEFQVLNGTLYLREEEKIYRFVYHILPEIQEAADVFYTEKFRKIQVRPVSSFSGRVRLDEGSDMLEFSLQLDDINPAEIRDIFKSLKEKKKYHRLKDGSFLPLDTPHLHQLKKMMDALNISERGLNKGVIRLPKYRALYIDSCLRESNLRAERNLSFKQLVQNITEPQDMEFDVPSGIEGTLRDYQKTGFKWLKTLAMYGFGGILADDMGLGKTIQTITFIVSERERMQEPVLVIAPTSVIYNWQDEVQKFAPGLKVVVVSGTPEERDKLITEAQNADLVITSYVLLRRDIDKYKDINFGYCFLDEAQHIKNPNSLSARAVKTIKAKGYFALTGTPLENNLTELWSIFDFVMPGFLLSHQQFVKKYERPILNNKDEKALKELQKQVAPFILRRMKKDVLQELPPKFEHKVLTDLTREQKEVYLAYWQKAKGEIEEAIAASGFEKSRIKILSVLTRLRQICCHPAVFLENYKGDSGKLMYLRDFIKDAAAGGHRILLFSQFTEMLKIISNLMDDEQIAYFYLDGSTKTKTRGQMVKAFNEGQRDVFLISLKAGGTGLNLTGADMVIHYDPWWNPAVEEQAADRAYRIGQKNSVQVINLITRGTIEEKIYEMQQKKKAMINSVIKPGETLLSKMTEQEIRELFNI
ncbi:MAG: DEAD/DEAH box helicase [Desulfotomaculum sp.]|nr:DEAD/DEAH box helicase [Desulfotomaculum sp.]